jgi:hypothetical protein
MVTKDMEIIILDLILILIKITMMETTIVIIVMVDRYEATQDRLEMFGIKEKKAMTNFIKKGVQIKEIVMETNIENNCHKIL